MTERRTTLPDPPDRAAGIQRTLPSAPRERPERPGPAVAVPEADRRLGRYRRGVVATVAEPVPPGRSPSPDDTPLPDERFINRELSWLEFGARLLGLAADERLALFERVKFLSIFAEGLDEFFQVRVAGLEDQVAAGLRTRSPDGMSPAEQLQAITRRATELIAWQSSIFRHHLAPALEAAGVVMADWHTLDGPDRDHLVDVFNRMIFPVLTPLAVDQGHPFPYISNLSLNLVVRVTNPLTGEERIARVKVPPLLPRFVVMPDQRRFVPIEQVIAAHLDAIFPAMVITEHHAFRVTRNADLSVEEDEAGDLLAAVELELHRRRFGQAVRLEAASGISTDLLDMLIAEVDVPEENVYLFDVPLDLGGLADLCDLDRPDLSAPPWTPVTPPRLAAGTDLFTVLSEQDVLVHHPYESFVTSVEAFVAQAAEDPDVLAIKQTLYRSGKDSPIVASLIRASQAGKQVTAVVELQARFDEQANIAWARALEEAGVQVTYGLVSLKTHCKISLVVRREGDRIRRFCHLSTGNYNSVTAGTYEDLGLLTSAPDIGADVGELFNLLAGSGDPPTFRRLAVSPISTRSDLLAAIDGERQAGPAGRIVLKTNGLTDPGIIDALYRAAQAGATVDLVVRGRCCLRAGVPGLSEGIRVRSLVGRYLEHSRIFLFGGVDDRPLRVWIGSPDLMERNLDRRVEVMVPIDDLDLRARLVAVLEATLADQANSWELQPDGDWNRVAPGPGALGRDVQRHLQSEALGAEERRRAATPPMPAAVRAGPRSVPDELEPLAPVPARPTASGTGTTVVDRPVESAGPVPSVSVPSVSATRPSGSPRWWQRLFRRGR